MSLTATIKSFFSPLPKKKVDFRPSSFKKKDDLSKDPPTPPSLPSGVRSSGFTPNNTLKLKQALIDAKETRATAFKNAQHALSSAFDIYGVKPAPSIYKPGFKIDVLDEGTEIGNFDDDLDMSMGLSGFSLDFSLPNKNGNQYNSITLTGSIPPSSIKFNSFYGGIMPKVVPASISSMSDPLPQVDKHLDDLLRAGLPQIDHALFAPKDVASGAVDIQPNPRTGKIARVEFDVVIGRPQWSNQIHAIKNSIGKEIYLASNHAIIRDAVKQFNEKLKEMYGGKTPVFSIESGTMFKTGLIDKAAPALEFHGLRFPLNGAKIIAVFSSGDNYRLGDTMEEVRKEIELIGNSCQFYILGEMELDEQEENLTEMVIECFGYNNPHRMNVNKELFRIL